MKIVGLLSATFLLILPMGPPAYADELLFDRGLPTIGVNRYDSEPPHPPSPERSNLRWRGGVENDRFVGDDFIIGEVGDRYRIDHIRTWAVIGYRDRDLIEPDALGDWFSQVRLLGGAPTDDRLPVLAGGSLAFGSNTTDSSQVVISKGSYTRDRDRYDNFGYRVALWQIDFVNLNWVVEGGTRYNFSVQGIGRPIPDADWSHVWYNHASNAEFSGSPQEGADDLMLVFSNEGEFLYILEGDSEWDKPTDINIQIFGEPLAVDTSASSPASPPPDMTLPNIVQELREVGLLTGRAYQKALIEAEQGALERRSHLLARVADEAYERFLSENNIPRRAIVVIGIAERYSEEYLAELRRFLDQLNQTGALSQRVYRQLQEDIAAGRVRTSESLYRQAASLMTWYEELEPDRFAPYINRLQEVGVLSATARENLLAALEAERLSNPIEPLQYMDRGVLFDLRDYSNNPEEYFPAIHQAIAGMLFETGVLGKTLNDFGLALRPSEELGEILENLGESNRSLLESLASQKDAVVSVQFDGRLYRHASFYSSQNSEGDFLGKLESSEFIHLFNKILRDQASPYRLYSVGPLHISEPNFGPPIPPYAKFGVIALTESQAEVYFESSSRQHDPLPALTSDRIDELLALFEQIGLFEHLSEEQIAAGRDRIAESYITRTDDLFAAFDDVILLFEWESGNVDNPYQALTNEFATISRGYFSPTQVTNEFDWDNGTAGQTFTLNGTEYSTSLEYNGDWLDPKFFKFILSVAEREVPQGKFRAIYDGYDLAGYLFLTDAQFEALQAENLFQFEPVR